MELSRSKLSYEAVAAYWIGTISALYVLSTSAPVGVPSMRLRPRPIGRGNSHCSIPNLFSTTIERFCERSLKPVDLARRLVISPKSPTISASDIGASDLGFGRHVPLAPFTESQKPDKLRSHPRLPDDSVCRHLGAFHRQRPVVT
jgi:hypothetical protein